MIPRPKIAALALTAGHSRRMGVNKLFLTLNGVSLLEIAIQNLRRLDVDEVFFVTGFEADKLEPILSAEGFRSVRNWEFETGIHSSIQAGLVNVPKDFAAFLVFLCDQPLLRISDVNNLIDAFEKSKATIVVPTYKGQRGNPVLISMKHREKILSTSGGDRGCHYLFSEFPDEILEFPVNNAGVLRDVDTPETYEGLKSYE